MKWHQILWELPQTVLGWFVSRRVTVENETAYKGRRMLWFKEDSWFSRLLSSGSLGLYILLPSGSDLNAAGHEYGHCLQSAKWGWLYLPVIGIPSLFNNLRGRIVYKGWTRAQSEADYYSRYPEKEADRLGGVERRN